MSDTPRGKKFFLSSIIFLSLILSVSAYTHIGGDNRDYKGSTSSFNANANLTSYIITPANSIIMPLLSGDFDNDGDKEIIGLTTTQLFVYSSTLGLQDSITFTGDLAGFAQHYDTINFENDNAMEIVVIGGNGGSAAFPVQIIQYNNSVLSFKGNHSTMTVTSDTTKAWVVCDDPANTCYGITLGDRNGQTNADLYATPFNNTNQGVVGQLVNQFIFKNTNGATGYCMPQLGVTIGDHDDNGVKDVFISGITTSDAGSEKLTIYTVRVGDNYSDLTTSTIIDKTLDDWTDAAACNDEEELSITQSIIKDLDRSNTNTLEILTGVKKDDDDYRLYLYDSSGNELDDYPELGGHTGESLINIYIADWYQENKGFCMQTLETAENRIFVTCASNFKPSGITGIFDNEQYFITTTYNLTEGQTQLSHSTKANTSNTDSEHLNNYGVFAHGDDGTAMSKNFDMPLTNVVATPSDIDNDGYDDLILWDSPSIRILSTSPFKYGCNEQPPEADFSKCYESININPCTTQTILQNSTMQVQIVFYDFDQGLINANVTIYADNPNSQTSGNLYNFTSGQAHTFSISDSLTPLTANVTGSNLKLRINIWNSEKPGQINTIVRTFTVSGEFGSTLNDGCIETIAGVPPVDSTVIPQDVSADSNNVITSFADEMAETGGMSTSAYILFVTLMVALGVFVGVLNTSMNPIKAASYSLAASLTTIFFGAIFGMLSPFWIIVPIIIILATFFVFRIFFGSGEN